MEQLVIPQLSGSSFVKKVLQFHEESEDGAAE
jgi:hypothetical protein